MNVLFGPQAPAVPPTSTLREGGGGAVPPGWREAPLHDCSSCEGGEGRGPGGQGRGWLGNWHCSAGGVRRSPHLQASCVGCGPPGSALTPSIDHMGEECMASPFPAPLTSWVRWGSRIEVSPGSRVGCASVAHPLCNHLPGYVSICVFFLTALSFQFLI